MAVSLGQRLGAYRLETLIGRGAFGHVLAAFEVFHS